MLNQDKKLFVAGPDLCLCSFCQSLLCMYLASLRQASGHAFKQGLALAAFMTSEQFIFIKGASYEPG